MNRLIRIAALSFAFSAPLLSFAQESQPLTRADVRAQLTQLQGVGYNPHSVSDTRYPSDIQAAQARVTSNNESYGGAATGTTQFGSNIAPALGADRTYAHH